MCEGGTSTTYTRAGSGSGERAATQDGARVATYRPPRLSGYLPVTGTVVGSVPRARRPLGRVTVWTRAHAPEAPST
jgi:hypothetical protein